MSRLSKWVQPHGKPDLSQSESVLMKLDQKKPEQKINWGDRRASLISQPKDAIQLRFLSDTQEFEIDKFEVQYKNKTKWPWKKGCWFGLVPVKEGSGSQIE